MLGNRAALWECILALTKLGAVMIPSTTLLTPADIARPRRARQRRARHRASRRRPDSFADIAGDFTRIAVGDRGRRMAPLRRFPDRRRATSRRTDRRRPTDPLFLYFTSGTTAQPKLVEHTHVSYPIGHLSTMYWLASAARRRAPQHLVAGLGEARMEQRLRAVERRGDRADPQRRALLGDAPARHADAMRGHQPLRAADGVADAHPGGPERVAARRCARC